ncbi:MAG: membrane dipeptidase [Polyangiaceae bacterium]|nr:membrane dipeptidase [Polyangiaceae bacterium]
MSTPVAYSEPSAWAGRLGISREAVEIYLSSDVIDLHVDSFLWTRLVGYDVLARHRFQPLGGALFGHVDLPRMLDAHVTGAHWAITTNPLRTAKGRLRAFECNLQRLSATLASCPRAALCRTYSDYQRALAERRHAAFLAVQGGNAFDADLGVLERLSSGLLVRVTLVHLTSSALGTTSSPLRLVTRGGLSPLGQELVRRLNALRIFVDLAHIHPMGFWDAFEAHDRTQPLLVTHTGVRGVFPHWRNIDDAQLRAVAETGGVVGIMFHAPFLGDPYWRGRARSVVRHLCHVVATTGEDHAALGSDWDGAISPPRDLRTCHELPRLVEHMLEFGWNAERIRKILGGNFLRALRQLRP